MSSSRPTSTSDVLIEQAIARHGSVSETLLCTDHSAEDVQRVWDRMNSALTHADKLGRERNQPCGTPAAYKRHLRHREPVDDLCRRAGRAANARYGSSRKCERTAAVA